jgi:MFS transporter, UMF1 family
LLVRCIKTSGFFSCAKPEIPFVCSIVKAMDWNEPKKQRWFNLRVVAWALFDLGVTIFSMLVISRFFGPWVKHQMGGSVSAFNRTAAISMIAAAFLQIVLSPISDELGRRRIFVVWFTLLCIAATWAIAFAPTLAWGLFFFAIANLGYQTASVFYNAMLGDVSDDRHKARVSGIGIGVGYVGSILGLILAQFFVDAKNHHYSRVFELTAILMVIFVLPLFLFVKEKPSLVRLNLAQSLTNSIGSFVTTLRRVTRNREMLLFFIASLLILDAVHTVILNMALCCETLFDLDPAKGFVWPLSWKDQMLIPFKLSELDSFIIVSTVFAIFGALIIGDIADKTSHYKTLLAVVIIWMIALAIAMLSVKKKLFWVAGPLFGIGLGGIWTVSRAYLQELCHPEERSQMFALFGLVGRGAAVLGPFVWATVFDIFQPMVGDRKAYRIAIATMLALVAIGFWILLKAKPKTQNPSYLRS